MKSYRLLFLLPLLFASCGTVHDWQELKTVPMSQAECYDGLSFIASQDFAPDFAVCDRGLGIWQSRWRTRQMPIFGLSRYRLRAEVLLDESSARDGWIIRYVVQQQKVEDPRRRREPAEQDWSDDGQYREREALFGDRLRRKLGPRP